MGADIIGHCRFPASKIKSGEKIDGWYDLHDGAVGGDDKGESKGRKWGKGKKKKEGPGAGTHSKQPRVRLSIKFVPLSTAGLQQAPQQPSQQAPQQAAALPVDAPADAQATSQDVGPLARKGSTPPAERSRWASLVHPSYCSARHGNTVTLYHDAAVGGGFKPQIELEGGVSWEPQGCWRDVYR